MAKHRAVIVGAGRIGAGYKWDQDLGYTHAGAYAALKDRVELVGFVEPDEERGKAAFEKWGVPFVSDPKPMIDALCCAIGEWKPDIVSVCTHPDETRGPIMYALQENRHIVKGVWCEKPFVPAKGRFHSMPPVPPILTQVNYQRRADSRHQELRYGLSAMQGRKKLIVYGKDDETTRCHFRDLSRFWDVPLDYRPFNGPCAYVLETEVGPFWFDGGNGGVDSAKCFVAMLENLLDAVDDGVPLLSPPYTENQ